MINMEMPLNLVCGLRGIFCVVVRPRWGAGADARFERPYIVDSLCSLRPEFDCGLFRGQYFDVIPDRV